MRRSLSLASEMDELSVSPQRIKSSPRMRRVASSFAEEHHSSLLTHIIVRLKSPPPVHPRMPHALLRGAPPPFAAKTMCDLTLPPSIVTDSDEDDTCDSPPPLRKVRKLGPQPSVGIESPPFLALPSSMRPAPSRDLGSLLFPQ